MMEPKTLLILTTLAGPTIVVAVAFACLTLTRHDKLRNGYVRVVLFTVLGLTFLRNVLDKGIPATLPGFIELASAISITAYAIYKLLILSIRRTATS